MKTLGETEKELHTMNISEIEADVCGKQPKLEIEKEYVRRISLRSPCSMRREAQESFYGKFSIPILNYILYRIFHNSCTRQDILGEYCIFISKENSEPPYEPYYKLNLYKGKNNSTLRHNVSEMTVRHFLNKKKKADKISSLSVSIDGSTVIKNVKGGDEVIENPWFSLFLSSGTYGKGRSEITSDKYKKIDEVFNQMSNPPQEWSQPGEKSRLYKRLTEYGPLYVKVIKLMFMDGISALEAFEQLETDVANTAQTPVSGWTEKQKQDRMANLKAKALKTFKTIVDNEKINF